MSIYSHFVLSKKIVFICIFICFCPSSLLADLSWLDRDQTCESFAQNLAEFFKPLPDFEVWPQKKKDELSKVLDAACGQRFAQCKFAVCYSFGRFKTQELDETAASAQAERLNWLLEVQSCEDLKGEFKRRYSGVGRFELLNESGKQELAQVLDLMCSDRFSHCGFKSCPVRQSVISESTVGSSVNLAVNVPANEVSSSSLISASAGESSSEVAQVSSLVEISSEAGDLSNFSAEEIQAAAEDGLKSLYLSHRVRQQERIKAAVKAEESRQASWSTLRNPAVDDCGEEEMVNVQDLVVPAFEDERNTTPLFSAGPNTRIRQSKKGQTGIKVLPGGASSSAARESSHSQRKAPLIDSF